MCGSPTFRRSVLRYSSLVRCCRSRLAIPHGALLPGQLRSDPRRLSVLSAGPKMPERRRIRPFKGRRHATALHRRLAHARLQGKRVGWRARELRWERQARKKSPRRPPGDGAHTACAISRASLWQAACHGLLCTGNLAGLPVCAQHLQNKATHAQRPRGKGMQRFAGRRWTLAAGGGGGLDTDAPPAGLAVLFRWLAAWQGTTRLAWASRQQRRYH